MKVFVTGANGFLGSHLLRAFAAEGHDVHGSARGGAARVALPAGRRHRLELGARPAAKLFAGCDALVHCAHDPRAEAFETNVEGTQRVARTARDAGVGLQIFVGSYSAHPAATGPYGRAKWQLERFFVEEGHCVLKPGLIVGDGGLFARILAAIRRLRIAPLIDGGRGEVPVVGIDDVVAASARLIREPRPGVFRLHLDERVPLRELIDAALALDGTRALRVPLPYALASLALTLAEPLPIALPIGRESLEAFRANQSVSDASDLSSLVERPQSLEEMLRRASRESAP